MLYTSETVYESELISSTNGYTADNEGQMPRDMGLQYYAIPYAVVDGEYIYGPVDVYSIQAYAAVAFERGSDGIKKTMEAMMRFAKHTLLYLDDLNKTTSDVSMFDAVLEEYGYSTELSWSAADETLVPEQVVVTQPEYSAAIPAWAGSSLLMTEQTGISYIAKGKLSGGMKVLYWDEADYAAANGNPTIENATGELETLAFNDSWDQGLKTGISARFSDLVFYARIYNPATGEYGAVSGDSVTCYLARLINKYKNDAENEVKLSFARAYLKYAAEAKDYLENK